MENDPILMPFISLPARYMVKNFLPLTTQQTKDILTLDLLNANTKAYIANMEALWGAKFPIHHTLEQLAPFECFTTPDTYSDLQWLTSLMGQLMGRTSHNLWAANISQCWRIFHISWASQHQLECAGAPWSNCYLLLDFTLLLICVSVQCSKSSYLIRIP